MRATCTFSIDQAINNWPCQQPDELADLTALDEQEPTAEPQGRGGLQGTRDTE